MNISAVFIKRPVMTLLVTIATICLGVASYIKLPVASMPNVESPVITISAAYLGSSASTMAKLIARPIEQQVLAIPGVQSVYSQSFNGQATIVATFSLDRNIDGVAVDIENALQQAQSQLPSDLPTYPSYSKTNPSDQPVIYIGLTSDTLTAADLYTKGAEIVQRAFTTVEGVGQVNIFGSSPAIRIQLDNEKLAYLGISHQVIAHAVAAANPQIPTGKLDSTSTTLTFEVEGELNDLKAFENVIIREKDGQYLRLKDVAKIEMGVQQRDMEARYWERGGVQSNNAIVIAVIRQSGANTVEISKGIREKMKELEVILPGSIHMAVLYDQGVAVVESFNNVQETLIEAFLLVVAVIFLFLARFRDTLVPVVALPMSLLLTLILMKILGYSLDNLSLLALVLAIGFVVDDAIVVLENTVRHMEMGKSPFEAALKGASEIGLTIVSISLALVSVFIPLLFMGGVLGRMLEEFAVTIVLAILSSGIVSLTLSPLMCRLFLKQHKDGHEKKNALERFTEYFVNGMIQKYLVLLRWFFKYRFMGIVLWLGCVGGTFAIAAILPKSFLPPGDSGGIYGSFVARNGTSPTAMKGFQANLEGIVHESPHVAKTYSLTGVTSALAGNQGMLFAALKPHDERPDVTDVANQINAKLSQATGVMAGMAPIPTISFNTGSNANNTGAAGVQYQYELSGNLSLEDLYSSTRQFVEALRKVPGLKNPMAQLNDDNQQLTVQILRDKASALGVNVAAIEDALRMAFSNFIPSYVRTATDIYWIIVEAQNDARQYESDLSKLYVPTATGDLVPLLTLVKVTPTTGPSLIKHKNQSNMALVTFALEEGVALGEATKSVEKIASEVLPDELLREFSGDAATFKQSTSDLGFLLILAIFTMYLILGILYESFIQPLTILSTLPVAGFGGVLTLLMFGSEFSFYAIVGFFLLLGIVSKNGIMLVDFANQHQAEEQCTPEVAMYEAAQTRFRPILMTGLAAIMGAMPMALGSGGPSAGFQPMGLMIVGGLAFSQFLTLLVTPVVYLYFEKLRQKPAKAAPKALEAPDEAMG
jgi:HAE1 family hydrophobic/amphiphilic exporter-1